MTRGAVGLESPLGERQVFVETADNSSSLLSSLPLFRS